MIRIMTNRKNTKFRKEVILELAKDNDYKSISEISNSIKIPFETIDNYLKEKDINNLIEYKSINKVTATGPRLTKVYKLKPNLGNLVTIFDYLNNRQYIKELMQTNHYKNLLPDIANKAKNDFGNLNENDKISSETKLKPFFEMSLNLSPSSVVFILKYNKERLKNNEAIKKLYPIGIDLRSFIMILTGLTMNDLIEETIKEEELYKYCQ